VDRLHFLGDVAGYFPEGRRCLGLLDRAGAIVQRGNHEALLMQGGGEAPAYRHAEALADLGSELVEGFAAWPIKRSEQWEDRRALLVHGTPEDPLDGREWPGDDHSRFAALGVDVLALAHTHRPFVARAGGTLVVNPGSVGLPRDVGALSAYAIYDTERHEAQVHRVPLDVDAVLARYGDAIDDSVRAVLARTAGTVAS
jgi:predicted phosphodiesterase